MTTHRQLLLCALSAAILLAIAGCSNKTPEQPAAVASSSQSDSTGPWRMQLRISPDHPSMVKPMTFVLHVTDQRGQPVNDVQVKGSLTMKVMDMGATAVTFSPKGNGDYEAGVKGMDMSGPWNLAINVTHGSVHGTKNFEVTVFD